MRKFASVTLSLIMAVSSASAFEPEAVVEISGKTTQKGSMTVVTDKRTGEDYVVKGFGKDAKTFKGLFRLIESNNGKLVPAVVFEQDLPSIQELLSVPRASAITPKASQSLEAEFIFPKAVERDARVFLERFRAYRAAALPRVVSELRKLGITGSSSAYSSITKANKAAYRANKALYERAVAACDDYVDACRNHGVWRSVDPKKTYLDLHKATNLLRVVDIRSGVTLLCVPFAYGANPDGAAKRKSGDMRTPEVPASLANYESTPFYVGRRTNGTAAPGMTTRCLGVSSTRAKDKFWVSHGMNIAMHGTPDKWSMGLRASHGCCRIIDRHIIHVFNLTAVNTKIVIHGLGGNSVMPTKPVLAVGSTGVIDVSSTLNVRSGPSTSHSKVGKLNGGQRVKILAHQDGWYQIDGNGMRGWVSGDYVRSA